MKTKMSLAHKLKSTAFVTTCSIGAFFGIGIYRNEDQFYDKFLMPIVHMCPPELSHRLAVLGFKYKLFPKQQKIDSERLRTKLFDFTMENPLGLAAGFDKHGESMDGLSRIGFGFIEIGSITPEPQPGNEKPRVFRLIDDKAIINRYGFNSDGHANVFERLSKFRKDDSNIIIGVNLGKNKATEVAYEDYIKGINKFASVASYFVINISSPNTAGLRSLQQADHLKLLLSKVIHTRNKLEQGKRPPIFLKISPDLSHNDVCDIISVISEKECRVDGLIVSNTTIERNECLKSQEKIEVGGLSGAPLKNQSTRLIAKIYIMTEGLIPIIGVGGIFNGQDAFEKITAGASALQLYTSLIFHGPPIVQKIKKELDELLEANGLENVEKARGIQAHILAGEK
ncbi:dihydroorotate dehydrogenase (quinone), mitochondrial [Sitodiplosis mosellana]|uniref:dihydroorotate dehydrogenase (quinone), mitochondrial n=1 Tax=Sitodiplosis mosellana TaxID=263140 RepID=UPI0024452E2A|nr:dihydroorotate dehydrogenase (quinone), mitochondrial [Sitodiplosis mosellana]